MAAAHLPRLLTAEEAAAYLGHIPVAEFVRSGWARVTIGRTVRYDKVALDAHLDALTGLGAKSPPSAHNDAEDSAEAALDRFIGRG